MTVQPLHTRPGPDGGDNRPNLPGGQRWTPPGGRRPSKLKWILLGAVAVAVIGAGAYIALKPKSGADGKPVAGAEGEKDSSSILTVTTVKATPSDVPRLLMVTGSLAAWDELPIGTQTSGLAITEVLVDEGDKVKAGQLLARFDDKVLRADLLSKEASLREAQALATEADANIRRAEELARTGAISTRDLDARRSNALTTKARVGVAEAAKVQAIARLAQTEVRSPTDGTIAKRNARLGAVMSAGGTELFRIIRDDRVELLAEVPEIDLRQLVVGQTAELSAVDINGKPFIGTIRIISPVVDTKSRIGTVKIDVPHDPYLRPGMFLTAKVRTGMQSAPVLPEEAVVYRDAKSWAVVVDAAKDDKGHHTVTAREVQTGPRDGSRLAILSGVKPGEDVVLTGAGYLKTGDKVIITEAPTDKINPLPAN
ncbi:efflux RND transporter periplasmic adaptor subunit [Niveispirillum sp.]|uniref:efflux RND transporter periplasmic adaptor subunit n=1 Tax=Niveispirillum sp. TaxID=1917217 RepID=UPI001B79A099|nr:efflux RND transporter periplasmic adaptor subunit [Niveispirillum sp.]MBP7338270.1 efflux RND transporter periplasmic adaptor subunit [Niveispirillum sp.]